MYVFKGVRKYCHAWVRDILQRESKFLVHYLLSSTRIALAHIALGEFISIYRGVYSSSVVAYLSYVPSLSPAATFVKQNPKDREVHCRVWKVANIVRIAFHSFFATYSYVLIFFSKRFPPVFNSQLNPTLNSHTYMQCRHCKSGSVLIRIILSDSDRRPRLAYWSGCRSGAHFWKQK
jgi:hypothetical protein